MAGGLNPDTRAQLDAFRRRWNRLNNWSGLFGGASVLLTGAGLAALADGFILLEPATRRLLGLLVYGLAFAVWFALTGRYWLRPLKDRDIARRLETRWPGLEGKVLAAVELAETRLEAKFDSEAFREILQRDVADRVRGLNMRSVLPGSGLTRWFMIFLGIGSAVASLVLFTPWRFENLLARALLPWGEIERPSRVKIAVLSPSADTSWLPVGDEYEIRVRVTGPDPDRVRLESWYGEIARTWNMAQMGDGEYAAKLTIGAADTRFRVTAGDGSTGVIQLPTRPRPHVAHYEKQYTFPDYAGMKSRTVIDADGDLAALEGTTVLLRMKVDQAVKAGEMIITTEAATNTIPLAAPAPDLVEARVVLTNAATYQVRLEAAETGFRNQFAPRYEIKPWPDLPPKISLTQPEGGRVAAVDERVLVEGKASDEIGLRRAVQKVQVNGGEWQEFSLSLDNPTNTVIRRDFDLIPLSLRPGDRVRTRLAAWDNKGATAESEAVELVIGTPTVRAVDQRELRQWQKLGDAMGALVRSTEAMETSLNEEGAAKFASENPLERDQAAAGLKSMGAEVETGVETAMRELGSVLRWVTPGRESARLALFGEGLSRARNGLLPEVGREARKFAPPSENGAPDRLSAQARALNQHVRELDKAFQALMAGKLSSSTAALFEELAGRQEEINEPVRRDAGKDPNVWKRLARRQSEAAGQLAQGEQLLEPLKALADNNTSRRLNATQAQLRDARERVEQLARGGQPDASLRDPSAKLEREVQDAGKTLRAMAREQATAANRAEDVLRQLRRGAADDLRQLNQDLRRLENLARNGDSVADMERDEALRNAARQLRDTARFEERRPGGDPAFAAELGTTATGFESMAALANREVGPEEGEKLAAAEQSLRRVEAAHQVSNLEQSIKQLAREERWEDGSGRPADRSAEWDWINEELNNAQREVKRAGLPAAVSQALDRAERDPVRREIGRQMIDRKKGGEPESVADSVGQFAEIVAEARFAAEPAREESRRQLESLAPRLSDRLQRLASTARAQESGTRRALDGDRLSPRAVSDLTEAQQQLNESVAKGLEAIRRDGNRQNIFTAQGREMARDADDALEMIARPAAAAERSMNQAVAAVAPQDRRAALDRSVEENARLAEALGMVANHLRQRESGFAEETRRQLRAQEEALGIKEELDRRYARAENMERVAQGDPQALREALREQVRNDPEMREDVRRMTADSLAQAEASLAEAAAAQGEAARELQRPGGGVPPTAERAQADAQAGVARAAERLQEAREGASALDQAMGERVAAAAAEARAMAERGMARTSPPDASAAAQAAEQSARALSQLQERVEAERTAAAQASSSPQSERGASPQGSQASSNNNQSGPSGANQQGNPEGEPSSTSTPSGSPPDGQASASAQSGQSAQSNSGAAGSQSGAQAPGPGSNPAEGSPPSGNGPSTAGGRPGQASPDGQSSSSVAQASGGSSSGSGQQRPGQWLVRAMNALGGENTESRSITPEVRDALRAAFEAQAEAVRMARNEVFDNAAQAAAAQAGSPAAAGGSTGIQSPISGEGMGGGGVSNEPIGDADAIPIDWGRLPPRVARDLRDSLREGTASEYRDQVNAYFRLVAEQAAASAR